MPSNGNTFNKEIDATGDGASMSFRRDARLLAIIVCTSGTASGVTVTTGDASATYPPAADPIVVPLPGECAPRVFTVTSPDGRGSVIVWWTEDAPR